MGSVVERKLGRATLNRRVSSHSSLTEVSSLSASQSVRDARARGPVIKINAYKLIILRTAV